VVWVGIAGELAPLLALQKRIDEATVEWAEPEKREFTPHLTLARMKDPSHKDIRAIASFVEANKTSDFGQWRVDRIDLMQSVLARGGAIHSCIASVNLADRGSE
jgi:2'-5' RNA ligase